MRRLHRSHRCSVRIKDVKLYPSSRAAACTSAVSSLAAAARLDLTETPIDICVREQLVRRFRPLRCHLEIQLGRARDMPRRSRLWNEARNGRPGRFPPQKTIGMVVVAAFHHKRRGSSGRNNHAHLTMQPDRPPVMASDHFDRRPSGIRSPRYGLQRPTGFDQPLRNAVTCGV